MTFTLAPAARDAGHRLFAFDTLLSTSAEAMARARVGEPGPAWFVARHQTEGRGRRGNAWQTAPGNLATTLMFTTELPPATVATLGFVAGIALAAALDGCGAAAGTTRPDFALKWPNDVLASGAKLAGILLGTEEVDGRRAVTVGIGVNVEVAPVGLPYGATSLRVLGLATSAEELFTALTAAWIEASRSWNEGRGFDAIRRAWLARAAGLGGQVSVTTGAGIASGRFETIDGHGQLVLRGRDGSARPVSAGEVHFGSAATAMGEAS